MYFIKLNVYQSTYTNIIYVSIPFRYGQNSLNARFYNCNIKMYKFLQLTGSSGNLYVETNRVINMNDVTGNGLLYLTALGKRKLTMHISKLITNTYGITKAANLINVQLTETCVQNFQVRSESLVTP